MDIMDIDERAVVAQAVRKTRFIIWAINGMIRELPFMCSEDVETTIKILKGELGELEEILEVIE